jgi:hypothetical protein
MWNLLGIRKKHRDEGSSLRDRLADGAELAQLSPAQREHLAACPDCQDAADDVLISQTLLSNLPPVAATPGPWFAPRVMAAIAAREAELRQSLDAWAAVPRLAARLTWLSALALLVASTWLYQLPKSTQTSRNNNSSAESLFDSGAQSSGPQDDAVLPTEKAR